MINYSKKNINIIALIVSVIIFMCGIYINSQVNSIIKIDNENTNTKEKINIDISKNEEAIETDTWEISIPKIELKAPISEGTDKETMDKYVGHFENTAKNQGNICLAAHNRGYPVNYFQNIKQLEKGDLIIYTIGNTEKKYKVSMISIVEDTNWDNLQKTEDNRITLITCVENEPEYRRCIQGIEI